MGNNSNNFIGNLLVFIAGICGAYNIKVAVRTLKYGTEIERLIKDNEDLKKENLELKKIIKRHEQRRA